MSNEVTIWEPKEFKGSDLLPVQVASQAALVANIPVVGRESTDESDIRMPNLKLLQGMSDEVTQGLDGAQPGKFFLSSTKEVIDGPLRVLIISHSKSNVMYPKDNDPRYFGKEKCISKDGVEGTVYGFCDECKLHKKWDGRQPPLCAESHNFTVLTPQGPAVIRFKRTNYPAARDFVSNWRLSNKNLWHHPVEIRVLSDTKDLGGKKTTFYYMKMQWLVAQEIPIEVHKKAYETWQRFENAAGEGRLKMDEDGDE